MTEYSFSIRPAESNVIYLPFPVTEFTGGVTFATAPTSGGTFNNTGSVSFGSNRLVISLSAGQSSAITLPAFYQIRIGGNLVYNGKVFAIESSSVASPGQVEAYGYVTWSCDPMVAQSSATPAVTGRLLMTMVTIDRSTTIGKGYFNIATAANSPVTGQNFMGVYSKSGILLGGADITANLSGTFTELNSLKTISFTTPFAVTPGKYWVTFLFNATTGPSLHRAKPAMMLAMNGNLAAADYRVCYNSAGLTTLPSTIVPESNSSDSTIATPYWVALS